MVPQVYSDGTLCLDIIQDHWSPCHNICSILTSIQVGGRACGWGVRLGAAVVVAVAAAAAGQERS